MKLLISTFFFATALFANNLKNIHSFEATFKQSIINNSNKEIIYTGTIHIKKPSRIVWRYNEPIEKLVYIVNNNVTIIEPELEQAIFSKLDKDLNILELLDNAKKLSPSEYISTFNNTQYKLIIIDDTLQSISYKDTIDNNVLISFSKITQNQSISDEIFKFTIPNDYDIIKK
jgi:outer membrane lipoprotein carrier protein